MHLMWMLPLYLHINQKYDDDDYDDDDDDDDQTTAWYTTVYLDY